MGGEERRWEGEEMGGEEMGGETHLEVAHDNGEGPGMVRGQGWCTWK